MRSESEQAGALVERIFKHLFGHKIERWIGRQSDWQIWPPALMPGTSRFFDASARLIPSLWRRSDSLERALERLLSFYSFIRLDLPRHFHVPFLLLRIAGRR